MADPTPFTPGYSFTDWQTSNPTKPLPGNKVDQDMANIATSIDEAVEAIKDVRRSDGALKNEIVTLDSLDPTVRAGVGAGALASAAAAAASADAASDSAVAAAASATAADGSATAASGYASNALTSRNAASGFADDSAAAATLSQTARDFANKWAVEAEGVDVNDGVNPVGKSAYHWAQVALGAATGALPDNSVSMSKIVDGAVTEAKLAPAVRDKLAGPFDTLADAEAFEPVAAPEFIQTAGYASAGDGGGALYKKVASEPSHAGKFSITLSDGATAVWFEIAESVLTPQMFGAVGDGVAADDGAFVTWAAVLAARPAPRFGAIPSGAYKLNSANILIPAFTTVLGQGCIIDISGAPAGAGAFLVQGTEGTKYPLTVDATGSSTSGMSAANVVASGIVAGDWVRLTSDAVFDSLRTNSKVGEMAKIRSANSGTGALTFGTAGSVVRPLSDSYLVSQAATISKLNVLSDVHFIGRGKIISNNNFGVSQHKGILFDKTVRCSVDGWSGAKIDDVFLRVNDSTDFNGKSIHGENFNSSGTGYLVSVSGCSQDCYFEGLTGRLVRHLFATNNPTSSPGIPRRIIVNGFFSEESATASGGSGGDAMDTHAASEDIHFANGIIHNPSNCGVVMEGRGGSLHNIKVYNPVADGFLLNNWSDRSAEYCISDLQVFNAGRDGLRVTPAAGAGRVRCLSGGNFVSHRSVAVGFYINGSETQPIEKVSLSNIQVLGYGSSAGGIYFNEVKGGSANGLVTESSTATPAASNGTRLRNCENLSVSAINAALPSASTGNALLIEEGGTGVCRRITVDDVIATGAAPSSSTGVRIANNVDEVTVGPRRRFNSVTTAISWGTGTGHLKSDAVAAP